MWSGADSLQYKGSQGCCFHFHPRYLLAKSLFSIFNPLKPLWAFVSFRSQVIPACFEASKASSPETPSRCCLPQRKILLLCLDKPVLEHFIFLKKLLWWIQLPLLIIWRTSSPISKESSSLAGMYSVHLQSHLFHALAHWYTPPDNPLYCFLFIPG